MQVFRRLGGMGRLDVVFAMVGVAIASLYACLDCKARLVRRRRTVALIGHSPNRH